VTVLVLGLGVAACGGGGGDETSAPATAATGTTEVAAITKDELIRQGDQVCAEANSAIGAIEASTADETTTASQIADIYDGIAQQLGELGTPSDGQAPTEVIAAARDLAGGSTDTTALQTAATDYGFSDCADAPEATSYPSSSESTGTGSGSTESSPTETYTPPPAEPTETYTPPATTTPTPSSGGVAPTAPSAPTTPSTPSTGGSSGGSSSGGIGPG